jgi:hypothetical protein
MIARAPDATVFLSTSALIVGIFLTVVTAALVSSLPDRLEDLIHPLNRANHNERYTRAVRSGLFILIITNTVGTLFPFTLLVVNTMGPIPSAWIWVSFSYSICIIIVNLSAVSAIFIGPMSVRRKLSKDSFNLGTENKTVLSKSVLPEAAGKAVEYPSTHLARRHTLVGMGLGIVIGLTVAIRFKRQSSSGR